MGAICKVCLCPPVQPHKLSGIVGFKTPNTPEGTFFKQPKVVACYYIYSITVGYLSITFGYLYFTSIFPLSCYFYSSSTCI